LGSQREVAKGEQIFDAKRPVEAKSDAAGTAACHKKPT
jgi:hypothetical protein